MPCRFVQNSFYFRALVSFMCHSHVALFQADMYYVLCIKVTNIVHIRLLLSNREFSPFLQWLKHLEYHYVCEWSKGFLRVWAYNTMYVMLMLVQIKIRLLQSITNYNSNSTLRVTLRVKIWNNDSHVIHTLNSSYVRPQWIVPRIMIFNVAKIGCYVIHSLSSDLFCKYLYFMQQYVLYVKTNNAWMCNGFM